MFSFEVFLVKELKLKTVLGFEEDVCVCREPESRSDLEGQWEKEKDKSTRKRLRTGGEEQGKQNRKKTSG